MTVTAGARNPEARTLLQIHGARIVNGRAPNQPAVTAATPGTVVSSKPFVAPMAADPAHIQLFGEELGVHKEKVANGEVHAREPSPHIENIQVPVTREHLVVEHSDDTGRMGPERSVRIPLSDERVRIDKDTVLCEEHKVGRREVTQNESVSGRVRRERLLIDDASAKPDLRPGNG